MTTMHDEEFGPVTLRRSTKARSVRVKIGTNGKLRASLPLYAPAFLVKRLIERSRPQLREMLNEHEAKTIFAPGMEIGKSHTISVRPSGGHKTHVERAGQQIIVSLANNDTIDAPDIQRSIREHVIDALRIEAKSHLPRRLDHLASSLGFQYSKIRFSHASSRWGSCSSNGTISLNIALMKLPFELIDYVLVHELSHTVEMNHSTAFWQLVRRGDPAYETHRKALADQSPAI